MVAAQDPNAGRRPLVWSIAGVDSGGGAGLSADQRAAQAFGVHLCLVVAAVTAQNSRAVTRVEPVAPELLQAQLEALEQDMPPAAIKTGLLGSAENVALVARWVDRLREQAPVALVVDPVLGASSGRALADEAVIAAYRDLLLPRATLVTPNLDEARRLLPGTGQGTPAPALAQALRSRGASGVAVTGGDALQQAPGWALDWIATPQATGWLALPRLQAQHAHGTGCTFASSAASALARGFVLTDALVLAKMATTSALQHGYAAGQGAGPVLAQGGFALQPALLPCMSWPDEADAREFTGRLVAEEAAPAGPDIGLYAIVDSAPRVAQVLEAGVGVVQLRTKAPGAGHADWQTRLQTDLARALAACRNAGATLVVNDHWKQALELARGDARALALHLGQEDLLHLGQAGRARLAASGLPLGVSSHSLWELARARALRPWYVACGPVWPTLTKDMPWQAQGLDNLAWWVHMAGHPVVAIGGILEYDQAEQAVRSGAAGVCVVRGLGAEPARGVPHWQAAIAAGRAAPRLPVPEFPHPSLTFPT